MALSSVFLNLFIPMACSSPKLPEGAKRHAVVIVVDTLRADALEKAETPVIDRIAPDWNKHRSWSASTWTAPSVISLFTGMSLREHGWDFPMPKEMQLSGETYPGMPDLLTIAQRLKTEGFKTHGYYANPLLHRELGFGRGFDDWHFVEDRELLDYIGIEAKLADPKQRHLFYIHLFGPHQPLQPSLEARSRWGVEDKWMSRRGGMGHKKLLSKNEEAVQAYRRAYHAVIEDVDKQVEGLLAHLEPLLDDAVLVLTSDHGEMLGEHGLGGHGPHLFEPLTQVPFVARGGPDLPPHFSNVVLNDYLCKALKVEAEWKVDLESPMPLVSQREGQLALTPDGRYKGIWAEGFNAYDLQTDPLENAPLSGMQDRLETARTSWETAVPGAKLKASEGAIQEELVDGLKSLGYLE